MTGLGRAVDHVVTVIWGPGGLWGGWNRSWGIEGISGAAVGEAGHQGINPQGKLVVAAVRWRGGEVDLLGAENPLSPKAPLTISL